MPSEHVFEGRAAGVSHVERARNVGRRDRDHVGRTLVGFVVIRRKEAVFIPKIVPI